MLQPIIRISPQSIELPVLTPYLHIIYFLIIIALIRYILGNLIRQSINFLKAKWKEEISKQKIPDWTAKCKKKPDIPQKQDIKTIDLKGQYIQSIKFTINLVGNPKFWRAGFMMGNEKNFAHNIVDTENAITIHTGSGYNKKNNLLPIWKYYGEFKQNNSDSSSVISEDIKNIKLFLTINENNFMTVRIENDVVFAQRIEPSFRRRFLLKAWADANPDYKINFKDIKYSLWS